MEIFIMLGVVVLIGGTLLYVAYNETKDKQK